MKNYGVRFGSGDPRTFTGLTPTFLLFIDMAAGATRTPPAITEPIPSTGLYTFQYGTTTPIAFLIDANSTAPGTTGRYVTGTLDPSDRADEYGNSLMAYGATIVALGTTSVAWGSTIVYNVQSFGSSNVFLGNQNVGLGMTNMAKINLLQTSTDAYGLTNVALGTTNVAIGTTILANQALSSAAVGSTASSFGNSSTQPVDLFGYLKRIQENLEGNSSYNKVGGAFTILSRGGSYTLASKTITNSVTTVIKT